MIKIMNVVGARPNFMKMAPIIDAMNRFPSEIKHMLLHTGQHYDKKMSQSFFEVLGMPEPDIYLGVGSGSHAIQTGRIMQEFEKVCLQMDPDLVIVVGDVNSTLACSITAKKLGKKVAHVEAGLRSRDMSMPEEINRLCTDVISDYLFTTDYIADENLLREGIPKEKIIRVGNVMIDSLLKFKESAKILNVLQQNELNIKSYALVTLHRPSNVDDRYMLEELLRILALIGREIPLVFPVHPRTLSKIKEFGFEHYFSFGKSTTGVFLIEPQGYVEFLNLAMNAKFVLTDSGGIQEETLVLGVPCLTLRENTERPITCENGMNQLVGQSKEKIIRAIQDILKYEKIKPAIPDLWDGYAAQRIVEWLINNFDKREINTDSFCENFSSN